MPFSNNVKLIVLVVLIVLLVVMLNNNDKAQQQQQQQPQQAQQQQLTVSNPPVVEQQAQVQSQVAPVQAQSQSQPEPVIEGFDQQASAQATTQQQQVATTQQQAVEQDTSTTRTNMEQLAQQNEDNAITFNCSDYLPQDTNEDWFETDFNQAQVQCGDENLVVSNRFVTGVNTQGSSLQFANYDLRTRPPNPKQVVSPWNNSSAEPDYNIKPLWDTTNDN